MDDTVDEGTIKRTRRRVETESLEHRNPQRHTRRCRRAFPGHHSLEENDIAHRQDYGGTLRRRREPGHERHRRSTLRTPMRTRHTEQQHRSRQRVRDVTATVAVVQGGGDTAPGDPEKIR